jgi:hypothetical protein
LSRLEVSSALEELDGSLVRLIVDAGERSWQVRHPTVVDSMGDWLLQHTELIDLYCEHASLAELRRQTVCGAELLGATSLPRRLWPQVFARMLTPDAPAETALRFFASRCSWDALHSSEQFGEIVALLDRRRFISPLDADPRARLFLRLSHHGGLTADNQLRLLDEAIDAAVETFDPYVLTHGGFETAAAVHPDPAYWPSVIERFLTRIRDDLERHVTDRIAAFDSQVDPLDAVVGIAALLDYVEEWVGDDSVLELIETQRARLQDWAGDGGAAVGASETMDRFVKALFGIRADADDLFSDVDD